VKEKAGRTFREGDIEYGLGTHFDTAERPEGQWVLFEEERRVHPLSDAGPFSG